MANAYILPPSITQEEWDQAKAIAQRWKDVRSKAAFGNPGKALGLLARAFIHLEQCYDECVARSEDD